MSKFRSIKNSLTGGQISPSAEGRTDLPQYASACRLLKNMIPMIEGGAYRRPGTLFDYKIDASTHRYPVLIPFVVSQSEPYCISISAPENNTAAVFRAHRPTNTLNNSAVSSITNSLTAGPTVADLYNEFDHSLQYVQSVDVMTLVHPLKKPMRLRRTATDTFKVSDFDTDSSGTALTGTALRDAWPYRPQSTNGITLTPSGTSGSVTLTASAAFFNSGHIGAIFKINHSGTYGAARVTAYTDSTHVTATVIVNFGSTSAASTWWESAWSDYRGWPRSVVIYQGRIGYGGNATDRDSIWWSQFANHDVMSVAAVTDPRDPGIVTNATYPFTVEMSSQQLNLIQWMSADKSLMVGTEGDEFVVERETAGGFGCSNCKVTAESHYGSGHYMAVRAGNEILFAQQSNQEIRSLIFSFYEDTYTSEPVQALFGNYPKPNASIRFPYFSRIAWDASRKTLWCVDVGGNLFGLTRDRLAQVNAWHTHELGGTDVVVNSVAVVPSPSLGLNDVWLSVSRTINGATQHHVERFMGGGITTDSAFAPGLAINGNYFTDSSVFDANKYPSSEDYDSVGFDGAGIYDHLIGETVVGVAASTSGIFRLRDSEVIGSLGSTHVPLVEPYPPSYASKSYEIHFGLPFQSVVAPVRVEAGSQIGTAQGAIKRIHRLTMRFFKTLSAKFGPSLDNLETITFRSGDTPMGKSPELFTGDKTEDFDGDYDREGYLYIVQDDPLPFSVVSIIAEGQTYD